MLVDVNNVICDGCTNATIQQKLPAIKIFLIQKSYFQNKMIFNNFLKKKLNHKEKIFRRLVYVQF